MTIQFIETGSADSPLIAMHPQSHRECVEIATGLASVLSSASPQSFIDEESGIEIVFEVAAVSEGVVPIAPLLFICRLSLPAFQEALDRAEVFADAIARGERSVYQWLNETSAISLLLTSDGRW